MGIRGIVRDIIGIYVGYEIVRAFVSNNFVFGRGVLIAGALLFVFGIWFLLERFGVVPKFT